MSTEVTTIALLVMATATVMRQSVPELQLQCPPRPSLLQFVTVPEVVLVPSLPLLLQTREGIQGLARVLSPREPQRPSYAEAPMVRKTALLRRRSAAERALSFPSNASKQVKSEN